MTTIEARLARGPAAAAAGGRVEQEAAAAVAAFTERAAAAGLVDVAWATVDTPIGPLLVAGTSAGLVRVAFDVEDAVLEDLATRVSPRVLEVPSRLDPVRRELDEYFEGRRHAFDLTVDWSLSSGYRRQVLQALFVEVGFGETVTYGELARRTGNPRAFRAVGSAMATNPIPIVVPCHRVLRSGGALGGYGGGIETKRTLLTLEGALAPELLN
jgi:methylated-DNA-[protein]-cysteine S-methyltransferase